MHFFTERFIQINKKEHVLINLLKYALFIVSTCTDISLV